MNTKTTLIVALVAILLGAYVLVFETDMFDRRIPAPAAPDAQAPSQIAATGEPLLPADAITADKVTSIRLEKSGEPPVVLTRATSGGASRGGWVQAEPVRFKMRDQAIRDLVNAAAALRYTGVIKPGEGGLTLEKLGLGGNGGPRAVLTFSGEGVESRTIVLGERAGAGRAYIALGDPRKIETVYVTGDALHDAALDKPMRELRSTTMALVTPGAARRVTLTAPNQPPIEAVMQDARWILNEPVKGRADRAAINSMINVISGAVIEQFVQDQPPDLAVYGLDKPSRVLTVEAVESLETDAADATAAGTAVHKLAIGSPADLERNRYFAMYNDVPVVFTLRKQDVEQLDRKPDQLRDPKLTPVARADVKELTVERKDQPPLHFVRQQGRWMFGEPKPAFSLEPPALDHLLDALLNAQAARYVPLADDQRPEAIATARMETATRPDAEVLTIYPAQIPAISENKTEHVMVVRQDETTGYIVPRESLSPLFDPPIAFRERTVLDIAEDQLLELHLTRAGEYPAEYHLVRSASPGGDSDAKLGEWKLDGLDRTKVRRLIESLTPLRAESWLTRDAGDDRDTATLRLKLSDGSERTLIIRPASGEAELTGESQAFTVSSELARLAGDELRETAVLSLDISDITAVKHGDLTVKHDAQGRYSLSGAGSTARLDEQKAAAIFDTLSSLRAEHFVDAKRADGEPAATLTVTTAGGAEHTLNLWLPADGPGVAQLGGHTFTLPRPAAKTLAPPPVK